MDHNFVIVNLYLFLQNSNDLLFVFLLCNVLNSFLQNSNGIFLNVLQKLRIIYSNILMYLVSF